jgi:TonB family protein
MCRRLRKRIRSSGQGEASLAAIAVAHGLGSGLDEKAIDAIKRWRFKPATRNGKAVARQATIPVNFRLL